MKKKIVLTLAGLALLGVGLVAACQKDPGYLYYTNPADVTNDVQGFSFRNKVDMLWVIGGMTEQAQNFNNGITQFMNAFVQYKLINWRMGVISTDPSYTPFLGMDTSTGPTFDKTSPNPGPTLVNSVMNVLQSYDGEKLFDPTVKQLAAYPNFLRDKAMLAIIWTNDAPDGSENTTQAQAMLDFLKQTKGDLSNVIVYGIIGATDLNCDPSTIDADWNFKGSEMEKVINSTGGKTLSLCDSTFGNALAAISEHLIAHIPQTSVFLAKRPIASTIKVVYQDQVIPGGPPGSGGYWMYNTSTNSLVFSDLSFAEGDIDNDTLHVTYKEDVGQTVN